MTIRARNRVTFSFFVFSSLVLLLEISFIFIKLIFNDFDFPPVDLTNYSSNFLFGYNPFCVIISALFFSIYACFSSFFISKAFENTQTIDVLFFILFLLSCITHSLRVFLPFFIEFQSFTKLLILFGNLTLFSRILAPLALIAAVLEKSEILKQTAERDCLILIIIAIFLTEKIPINTGIVEDNFSIGHSYSNVLRFFEISVVFLNVFSLVIRNIHNQNKQIITLGYFLLSVGYLLLFEVTSIFFLVSSLTFLGVGTYLFLNGIHKQFLFF